MNNDLTTDALLASDWISPAYQPPTTIQCVLLTGVTGFIGVFLLREWLLHSTSTLYCLVRDPNLAQVRQQLQQQLMQLKAWQAEYDERIVFVCGDLSQPALGLAEADFNQLAAQCDLIIHNGAQVNFMRPYETLKPANVDGTREVIRLALSDHAKPIHFISSIAVFFSDRHAQAAVVYENTPLDYDPSLKGGYKQSKWVAERLLLQARAQGLPVNIYRLARVFGDSVTGISTNYNDLLYRMLKACVLLEHYPLIDNSINLVPADYIGQAVFQLAHRPEALNQTFHLCNPHSIQWNTLFEWVKVSGRPLQAVSYPEWLKLLEQASRTANAPKFYAALRLSLRFPNYLLTPKPHFDTQKTTACLASTTLHCPATDHALISRYLAYFQQVGFPS